MMRRIIDLPILSSVVFLFLLDRNLLVLTEIVQCDSKESLLDHKLEVSGYSVTAVGLLSECFDKCDRDERCQSYNFNRTSQECHLLDVNRHFAENGSLVKAAFWIYSDNYYHPCTKIGQEKVILEVDKLGSKCNPADSCKDLLKKNRNLQSGTYYIKSPITTAGNRIYCHMKSIQGCGGGGWTLVMKINGRKITFQYDSPYWTDLSEYRPEAGETGFDDQEAKTAAYWSTNFTGLCLGMNVSGNTRWLMVKYTADSLYSVIADGQYKNTSMGRSAWKSLINDSSLQRGCNREGFNVNVNNMRVRIGIIGNNEVDCSSPDSRLGYGCYGNSCYDELIANNTCGNEAPQRCSSDNGLKHIFALGYILVQ